MTSPVTDVLSGGAARAARCFSAAVLSCSANSAGPSAETVFVPSRRTVGATRRLLGTVSSSGAGLANRLVIFRILSSRTGDTFT